MITQKKRQVEVRGSPTEKFFFRFGNGTVRGPFRTKRVNSRLLLSGRLTGSLRRRVYPSAKGHMGCTGDSGLHQRVWGMGLGPDFLGTHQIRVSSQETRPLQTNSLTASPEGVSWVSILRPRCRTLNAIASDDDRFSFGVSKVGSILQSPVTLVSSRDKVKSLSYQCNRKFLFF